METVTLGAILQFEVYFKMVALTEASTVWILEMKVAAAVELFLLCKKGGGIPSWATHLHLWPSAS